MKLNVSNLNETITNKTSMTMAGQAKKKGRSEPEIDWLATERPASVEKNQPAKIYLNIFNWPDGKLEVSGISGKVSKAYFLANPKTNLQFEQDKTTLSMMLPKVPLDKIATVICLEMK